MRCKNSWAQGLFSVLIVVPALALGATTNDTDSSTTVGELVRALDQVADKLATHPKVRTDFQALQKAHRLSDASEVFREYVRVRLAFELTRDGGLWNLRWAVTDREPRSDAIWEQWRDADTDFATNMRATATAECDELSALWAFLARALGVKHAGLFWPQWNHTVGVWTTQDSDDKAVRIVVPTTQVFLSRRASLGTTEFDASKQKTIYDYSRKDIALDATLPAALADTMLREARTWASHAQSELQTRRNRVSRRLGGS